MGHGDRCRREHAWKTHPTAITDRLLHQPGEFADGIDPAYVLGPVQATDAQGKGHILDLCGDCDLTILGTMYDTLRREVQ